MRGGFRIIDADRHVLEPIDMWKQYLDPAFRERAPYLAPAAGDAGPPVLTAEGRPVMRHVSARAQAEMVRTSYRRAPELHAATSAEGQLRAMDAAGVDVAFLYPTFAMYLVAMDDVDPALTSAFAAAYNRWLHDYCGLDRQRLQGVGLISPHEPAAMLRELDRVSEFGWRGVVVRPNPARGRLLGDPAYAPFWRACEERNLGVAVHEGTHSAAPTVGADRFVSRFSLHACSHPMEQMMAFLSLLEGGVLERHPGLRLAFLEAGCGWIPYWLWRLDEVEYRHLAGEVHENVRRPPSEYFRRQCFAAFEPDEPYLEQMIPMIGADRLLFGSDFPHLDHGGEVVEQAVSLEGRVPELRRLLSENAAQFFGLPA